MSSEQPWPNIPPDLAESQPYYADPYQAGPYPYGGAPQDALHPQEFAAVGEYGYAGYGDAYGYVSGQVEGGYAGAQSGEGTQDYGGFSEYAQYAQYAQFAQDDESGPYQQYEQYGPQPYAEQYVPPAGEYPDRDAPGRQVPRQYTEDPIPATGQDLQTGPAEPEFPSPGGQAAPAGPDGPAELWQDRAPKPKRSRRLTVVVVAVIVVLGGAGAYELLGGSSAPDGNTTDASVNPTTNSGPAKGGATASGSASAKVSASPSPSPSLTPAASVAIPSSAGGLTQLTNKVGEAGVSAMEKAASGSADLANAQFAEYAKTGTSTFFGNLTLTQLSKAPDIQKTYTLTGAAATLSALGATSLKDGQTEAPQVPGGAMACGQFTTGGNTLSLCIWVDPSEFGLFAGPRSLTDSQAAQYAEAIETASEH